MPDEPRPTDDPMYDLLLDIEHLESLREEMAELGVTTAAELASLLSAEATDVLTALQDLDLASMADLDARIGELHRQLDALEEQRS